MALTNEQKRAILRKVQKEVADGTPPPPWSKFAKQEPKPTPPPPKK